MIYTQMPTKDVKAFQKLGFLQKNVSPEKWSLHYGVLKFPSATNAPYGICVSLRTQLLREAQYSNPNKFQIVPA